MTCRHCQKNKCVRPRGLCWNCYYTPAIRDLFGPISKFGRRGPGNVNSVSRMPAVPTSASSGSDEKVEVMAGRAERGERLFHPADA
jgi:hypothetical protein